MKLKKPKTGWFPEVWKNDDAQFKFHAFAVHTNGKVEKAAERPLLIDAVLSADELSNMLNLYHRSAGRYAGKDVRTGKKVRSDKIAGMLYRSAEALKVLMKAHKKIFPKQK